MDLNSEQIDKLLYELRRIANAAEILAMKAEPRFTPLDSGLKSLRKEILETAAKKPQDPR
jgi:hypothetical protein